MRQSLAKEQSMNFLKYYFPKKKMRGKHVKLEIPNMKKLPDKN
jgi:hypothetical protein